jgi:predicted dehydrogenase
MKHNIGLIGCGYWGNNYRKLLKDNQKMNLIYICDLKLNDFSEGKSKMTNDYKDVLNDNSIDSIIIATPTETHYEIAKDSLNAGKHVLIEKPMTMNSKEAKGLIKIAKENEKKLMVGHVFMHNPAIQYLKKSIDRGELGDILFMDARWLGYGIVREKENVLWDLAPHNLSLFLYLNNPKPRSVNSFANSLKGISKDKEDIAQINLKFEGGYPIGCLSVSWIHPKKIRELTVVGNKKMAIFDDLSREKLTFYDIDVDDPSSINPEKYVIYGKIGSSFSPSLEGISPLEAQCNNFFESIERDTQPLSDGENGLEVVKLLEYAQKSIKNKGREILIK